MNWVNINTQETEVPGEINGARVSIKGDGNTVTYNDRGIQDRHDATYAPAPAATAEE